MKVMAGMGLWLMLALGQATAAVGQEPPAAGEFRRATALLQAGDSASASRIYRELAAQGHESASLYWNWAQAAQHHGAPGEAIWALLRARELDPADRAVIRELERLRELCGLDPAELSPQPLASIERAGRRVHLDLLAVALAVLSVAFHAVARWRSARRWPVTAAWGTAAAAVLAAAIPLAGLSVKPTAVVVQPRAPLVDAASPTAITVATLREGEVVPILDVAGDFVRIQDSAGARGWAHKDHIRRLGRPSPAE